MSGYKSKNWWQRIGKPKDQPNEIQKAREGLRRTTPSNRESHDSFTAVAARSVDSRPTSRLINNFRFSREQGSSPSGNRNSRVAYIQNEEHRVKKRKGPSNNMTSPRRKSTIGMLDPEKADQELRSWQKDGEAAQNAKDSAQAIEHDDHVHQSHLSVSSLSSVSATTRAKQLGSIDDIVSPIKHRRDTSKALEHGRTIPLHYVDGQYVDINGELEMSAGFRNISGNRKSPARSRPTGKDQHEKDCTRESAPNDDQIGIPSVHLQAHQQIELSLGDDQSRQSLAEHLHTTEVIADEPYVDLPSLSPAEAEIADRSGSIASSQANLRHVKGSNSKNLHSVRAHFRPQLLESQSMPYFDTATGKPKKQDEDAQGKLDVLHAMEPSRFSSSPKAFLLEDNASDDQDKTANRLSLAVASIIDPVVRDIAVGSRRLSGHQNTPPIHPSRRSRGIDYFTSFDPNMSRPPFEGGSLPNKRSSIYSTEGLAIIAGSEFGQIQESSHEPEVLQDEITSQQQELHEVDVTFKKSDAPSLNAEWKFPLPPSSQQNNTRKILSLDHEEDENYMAFKSSYRIVTNGDESSDEQDNDSTEDTFEPRPSNPIRDLPLVTRSGTRGIVVGDRIAARKGEMRAREASRSATANKVADADDFQGADSSTVSHNPWNLSLAKNRSIPVEAKGSADQSSPSMQSPDVDQADDRVPSFEGVGSVSVFERRNHRRPVRQGSALRTVQIENPINSPIPSSGHINPDSARESTASQEFLLSDTTTIPAYQPDLPVIVLDIAGPTTTRIITGKVESEESCDRKSSMDEFEGCVLDPGNPISRVLEETKNAISELRRDDNRPTIPQIRRIPPSEDGVSENTRGYDARYGPYPTADDTKTGPHRYRLPRRRNIWRYSEQPNTPKSKEYLLSPDRSDYVAGIRTRVGSENSLPSVDSGRLAPIIAIRTRSEKSPLSIESRHNAPSTGSRVRSENSRLATTRYASPRSPRRLSAITARKKRTKKSSRIGHELACSSPESENDMVLKSADETSPIQLARRRDIFKDGSEDAYTQAGAQPVSSKMVERVGQSTQAVPSIATPGGAFARDNDFDEYSISYNIPKLSRSRIPQSKNLEEIEDSSTEEVISPGAAASKGWSMADHKSPTPRTYVPSGVPKPNSYSSHIRVERKIFDQKDIKRTSIPLQRVSVDAFPAFKTKDLQAKDEIVLGKVRLDEMAFYFSLRKIADARNQGRKLTLEEFVAEGSGRGHSPRGDRSQEGVSNSSRFKNVKHFIEEDPVESRGQSRGDVESTDDEATRGRSRFSKSRIPVRTKPEQAHLVEKANRNNRTAKDTRFGVPPGYIADDRGRLLKKTRSDESMFAAIKQLDRPVDEETPLRRRRAVQENSKQLFTPLEGRRLRREFSTLQLEDIEEMVMPKNRSTATSTLPSQDNQPTSKLPTRKQSSTMKPLPAVIKQPSQAKTKPAGMAGFFRPPESAGESHRGLKKSKSVFDLLKPTNKEEKAIKAGRKALEKEKQAREEVEREVEERIRAANVQVAALNAEYLSANIEFTPLSVILNYARRDILEARKIDEKFRETVVKVLRDNNLSTDLVDFNLNDWDEYDKKLERFATSYRHDMTYGGAHVVRAEEFELPTFRR